MASTNPFANQPATSFWRTGVAEPGLYGFKDLWKCSLALGEKPRFATYGSCFAQHISRALVQRGQNWTDAEPAPHKTPPELAKEYNYGVFSSRTANIYTAAALATWVELALNPQGVENIDIWENDGQFRDSLRPMIEPNGFRSSESAMRMLQGTAHAFHRSIKDSDVFVFTMGLTEGFENSSTGQPYAMCPGTLAGTYDASRDVFRNYGFMDILTSMQNAIKGMQKINSEISVLLTVSPVPLTATATDDHVLLATTYSKSVLRAVAGELANSNSNVDYFPSYEIISAPPTRAQFFDPNMRTVSQYGVSLVMEHFFRGLNSDLTQNELPDPPKKKALTARQREILSDEKAEDLACEEQLLEAQNSN